MSTIKGLLIGYENASVRDVFVGSKASISTLIKGSNKSIGEMFRTGP